jgi:tyrosyl-tRNA synthetase
MGGAGFDENPELDAQIEMKMSKSVPVSGIFVHDEPEKIREKIRAGYCPPKLVKMNPVLEIARLVVFPERSQMTVAMPKSPEKSKTYESYSQLESEYGKGAVHPLDLKEAVAAGLAEMLEGVRQEFSRRPELLSRMLALEVTR